MLDKHQADNCKWLCNTELKDTIEGMTSEDYKERFRAEYKQLIIRLSKLEDIIAKQKTNKLEFELRCPLHILRLQAHCMESYVEILRTRAQYEGIDLD